MNKLKSLQKYFIKYRGRLFAGFFFITLSNLFAVLSPVKVRQVIDEVQQRVASYHGKALPDSVESDIVSAVVWSGILLLAYALLRGLFMFFMRQTIIVMSRHIEYDQKNEVFSHYQILHTHFYKTHFTGDLMNRIAEDVSRVRQYTGPAIMYLVNLIVLSVMCIGVMLKINVMLTLCVIAPLPFLAFSIYYVNKIIFKKSDKIQAQLSDLTTTAQESYSGVRVIKSFVQEKTMRRFFDTSSEEYRKSAINLSLTEAIYFPAMNFFIGLSLLSTILIGGYFAINGSISIGNIAQFVLYINLLMFPISSLGMVASLIQRAAASQQRIDEFLKTDPEIVSQPGAIDEKIKGAISFDKVNFTYAHTGIHALKDLTLNIKSGEKIAVIGKTGSGKSTIAHLLLRMYDINSGALKIDGHSLKDHDLNSLRNQIAYASQETFLFSDTIYNNIAFGKEGATKEEVLEAARRADFDKDVIQFANGYETVIGERGVMLSGGQKQRINLARALIRNSNIIILDECLSAVDTQTEKKIQQNLKTYLADKTTIVITHRIFTTWEFDKIIVLDDGKIVEEGDHQTLLALNGRYAKLYAHQTKMQLS